MPVLVRGFYFLPYSATGPIKKISSLSVETYNLILNELNMEEVIRQGDLKYELL